MSARVTPRPTMPSRRSVATQLIAWNLLAVALAALAIGFGL